ncbi:TPA: Rho termination factor N-terminal domain-containing protein [Clostridium botulinum]|uniref:Rho termination factor N-terminal domain-containing protein n=1 Tax=Clostridium botulinum TaxID=1491 RepID=UPI0029B91730|nr:Rho termination factor N-terminal domain-containing protein [Clostridium botulinum]HDK7188713.1 Rho termination factor N-terminal domain-containing protein [Clostridium botulinum]HDK7215632.1 Rho termination factor N-terminal domain-containing protein [Clostridium botulinum]HDK7231386.1 Rho termination factor N-terminal domain-containing protein [Clostridium botulinum]HDK7260744.1 Rho termination factor N-terminal domain-containing protein [Clostridium botulinum]
MYKLQKLNVEKIVLDENSRDKLLAQGFRLVGNEKSKITDKKNYSIMTVQELQNLCKDNNLEGYSKLSKEDLVKFLEEKM